MILNDFLSVLEAHITVSVNDANTILMEGDVDFLLRYFRYSKNGKREVALALKGEKCDLEIILYAERLNV